MRRLLPSVWLLGAALYTALTLVLSRPAIEQWPLPPRVNETVIAKQPPKAAMLIFQDKPQVELAAAAAPRPRPRPWPSARRVGPDAGYTTSAAAPASRRRRFAYSAAARSGDSREGGFARSRPRHRPSRLGQETSLVRYGAYRQREERVAARVWLRPPAAAVPACHCRGGGGAEECRVVTPVVAIGAAPIRRRRQAAQETCRDPLSLHRGPVPQDAHPVQNGPWASVHGVPTS